MESTIIDEDETMRHGKRCKHGKLLGSNKPKRRSVSRGRDSDDSDDMFSLDSRPNGRKDRPQQQHQQHKRLLDPNKGNDDDGDSNDRTKTVDRGRMKVTNCEQRPDDDSLAAKHKKRRRGKRGGRKRRRRRGQGPGLASQVLGSNSRTQTKQINSSVSSAHQPIAGRDIDRASRSRSRSSFHKDIPTRHQYRSRSRSKSRSLSMSVRGSRAIEKSRSRSKTRSRSRSPSWVRRNKRFYQERYSRSPTPPRVYSRSTGGYYRDSANYRNSHRSPNNRALLRSPDPYGRDFDARRRYESISASNVKQSKSSHRSPVITDNSTPSPVPPPVQLLARRPNHSTSTKALRDPSREQRSISDSNNNNVKASQSREYQALASASSVQVSNNISDQQQQRPSNQPESERRQNSTSTLAAASTTVNGTNVGLTKRELAERSLNARLGLAPIQHNVDARAPSSSISASSSSLLSRQATGASRAISADDPTNRDLEHSMRSKEIIAANHRRTIGEQQSITASVNNSNRYNIVGRPLPKIGAISLTQAARKPIVASKLFSDDIDHHHTTSGVSKATSKTQSFKVRHNGGYNQHDRADSSERDSESVMSLSTPIQDEENNGNSSDNAKLIRNHPINSSGDRHAEQFASSRISMGPSTPDDLDVYDPEAPVGPISPSNSPNASRNHMPLGLTSMVNQLRSTLSTSRSRHIDHGEIMSAVNNLLDSWRRSNPELLSNVHVSSDPATRNNAVATINSICDQLMNAASRGRMTRIEPLFSQTRSRSPPFRATTSSGIDADLSSDDELPSSAVEMEIHTKIMKKMKRQSYVEEQVKVALKPYYASREIDKEEYKEVLRRVVPLLCRSDENNPTRLKSLVETHVKSVKSNSK